MNPHEILNIKEKQVLDINFDNSDEKSEKFLLKTGSQNFDEILGGGFCSGNMYLIFGANKTGKTQFCHQICIQAFKQFSNVFCEKDQKSTIFLDTENTFRPERIQDISNARDFTPDNLLNSILIANIMSNSALLLSLNKVVEEVKKSPFRLLIMDSINNYFRSEQGDKNISFSETRSTFLKILKKITEITKKFNLITIATAQVSPNYYKEATVKELPVGNQYLNHFFSEYVYLKSNDDNENFAHLINSNILSEKILPYFITKKGIIDHL